MKRFNLKNILIISVSIFSLASHAFADECPDPESLTYDPASSKYTAPGGWISSTVTGVESSTRVKPAYSVYAYFGTSDAPAAGNQIMCDYTTNDPRLGLFNLFKYFHKVWPSTPYNSWSITSGSKDTITGYCDNPQSCGFAGY